MAEGIYSDPRSRWPGSGESGTTAPMRTAGTRAQPPQPRSHAALRPHPRRPVVERDPHGRAPTLASATLPKRLAAVSGACPQCPCRPPHMALPAAASNCPLPSPPGVLPCFCYVSPSGERLMASGRGNSWDMAPCGCGVSARLARSMLAAERSLTTTRSRGGRCSFGFLLGRSAREHARARQKEPHECTPQCDLLYTGQLRLGFDQNWPQIGQLRPMSADFDRLQPGFDFVRIWVEVRKFLDGFNRYWSISAEIVQNSVEIGPDLTKSRRVEPRILNGFQASEMSAQFGQEFGRPGLHPATLFSVVAETLSWSS